MFGKKELGDRASAAAFDSLAEVVKGGQNALNKTIEESGANQLLAFLGNATSGFIASLVLSCLRHVLNIEDSTGGWPLSHTEFY